MKILITGPNGSLGREILRQCKDAIGSNVDIARRDELRTVLSQHNPDVVINCAGVVKGRPLQSSHFIRANSLGPHILSEYCSSVNIKLVHISTDCVFSGVSTEGYDELSIPDPTEIYGKSKLLGEITTSPHLTIRTSFIGYGKRGLLNWLLNQQRLVNGYTHSIWNGVTTVAIARAMLELASSSAYGLMHIGGTPVSKCNLLELCVRQWNLPLQVVPVDGPRVNRTLVSTRNDVPTIPPLEDMIAELQVLGAP